MKNSFFQKRYGTALMLAAIIIGFLLLLPGSVTAAGEPGQYKGHYVVDLMTSKQPIDLSKLTRIEAFNIYRLYIIKHKKGGETFYRLRLGFFPDKATAIEVSRSLRSIFADARAAKASKTEKRLSVKSVVRWRKKGAGKTKKTATPKEEKKLGKMMNTAKKSMTAGRYAHAAGLYRKVLRSSKSKYSQSAQELLGLAMERSGKLTQARAEYKTYLLYYPKGKGAERVRQRLHALETARAKPRKKLRRARDRSRKESEFYGSFSQFYNRDESYTDTGGDVINRSSFANDLDFTIRKRDARYELTWVFVGGYEYDMLNSGEDSETRLSRAYVDVLDRTRQLSVRMGRQSRSTGGVFGRFDGALVSYQAFHQVKLNVVTGYPVDSSVFEKFNKNKSFNGLSADLGTFAEHWDFNVFVIKQKADGIIDRKAVGAEARYFDSGRSLFTLVDYDISYSELNTLLVVGNMKVDEKTSINASIDYRRSPALTTSNALQGQAEEKLSDLIVKMSEDQMRQLALDRTAKSRSFLFGLTRELNEKFQVSGDITVSELASTPASGGVEAVPGTGYEYFISTQLIGSSLIKEGDTAIVGFRYSDASTSDRVSFNLNTRYPVSREWRLNPRLRIDYSWNEDQSKKRTKIRPSLKTDYYWKRRVRFEFEGGLEWGYEWVASQSSNTTDYFMLAGYRMDF